ncbi:MAG: glycosyltransferase family 4 protein [Gaiellaceae bacterium]
MIRVGIDLSPLRQTRAGTARHIRGLLPYLEAEPDLELERFSFAASSRPRTLWLDTAWYLARLPRLASRSGCDVLHCPTYRAPIHSRVPLVVTVHDLAVFRHPEAFNRWSRRYAPLVIPRVLRAARRIIAVSSFTASELVTLLGVPEEKIRVVPNALAPLFQPHGDASSGDYALAVATLEPRKNLARIAEAARLAGIELRVVGASGWGGVTVSGDGVRWLGELSDEELACLYRGARCLVSASLYEGFGLQILEAMASGTPVVTSDRGAMAEVADGAAVLVDPLDAGSIAAGIREAEERRDELAAAGLERASHFSWQESARATVAVYGEAAL